MNDTPLQSALREMRAVFASRVTRFALVLTVFVLAVSGPFGTFESFNLGQRFAYWAVTVLASFVTGEGIAAFCIALLRRPIPRRWPRALVAALLTAVPVSLVVVAVNAVAYQRLELAAVLPIWLYTTLVTLVVVIALVSLSDRLQRPLPASAADETAPAASALPPPVLERVPLAQRGRLLALVVEDHYVDIVTDRGRTLVLMRLADAIRETAGVAGLQVHRSHWVALHAVVNAVRADGKLMLELSNGMRLPVSRGYLPAVKAAGLA